MDNRRNLVTRTHGTRIGRGLPSGYKHARFQVDLWSYRSCLATKFFCIENQTLINR